ncbi:hypothetical protein TrLO_g9772 [Triparma laevis f. longispina]|uniref:WW domain-containing protein n=1 Tax=Triparma laevis f. longispina TaxID=1714387 RepID=A0A9W7FR62_9STRA|nr:hypothetical protein TrLO_g9772 [Triparma laevis f. longispina]
MITLTRTHEEHERKKFSFKIKSSFLCSFGGSKNSKKKVTTAADKRQLSFRKNSSIQSSFGGNEDVWFEHVCEDGEENERQTYYHQPSTGETTWERPGEGESTEKAKAGQEGEDPEVVRSRTFTASEVKDEAFALALL